VHAPKHAVGSKHPDQVAMRTQRNMSPFFVLIAGSFYGVWFHRFVEPDLIRGAKIVCGSDNLTEGFYFALRLGTLFDFLPLGLLIALLLSRRFAVFRSHIAFALYGVLMAAAYLTYGALLITPMLRPVTYL
jgi:hypothetical protein